MAWSDAARAAALEARQRHGKIARGDKLNKREVARQIAEDNRMGMSKSAFARASREVSRYDGRGPPMVRGVPTRFSRGR
jgi:hypothetical protein